MARTKWSLLLAQAIRSQHSEWFGSRPKRWAVIPAKPRAPTTSPAPLSGSLRTNFSAKDPGIMSLNSAQQMICEKYAPVMESETQTTQTAAAKSLANMSHSERRLLTVTMAVESLLTIGLTLRDFTLTKTPMATCGSVTRLAISGVTAWAAYAISAQGGTWLAASILSQFSIAVLAGYIVLIDLRSPFLQFVDLNWSKHVPLVPLRITGLACILGLVAVFWLFYLIRRWRGPVTAGMKTIVALIPLVGFVQFWMQTDYLPRTSLPLVDLTTDLTPTGKTGDRVQLEAKVTINNRGSMPVNVGATLMRITAYPRTTGKPNQVSDAIEFGIAPAREYREDPLSTDQRKLLYANDLLPAGSMLAAGQSNSFRRVIDFNSHTMKLARLAVDAFFITSPRIAKVYTCPPLPGKPASHPQKSTDDGQSFQEEISKVTINSDGVKFLCREIRLMPRNVIHEMVGDRQGFAVMAIFSDPKNQSTEYPTLLMLPGANGNYQLDSLRYQKVSDANPTLTYNNMTVDYSPSEESPSAQK
jgi:hypothetical protein